MSNNCDFKALNKLWEDDKENFSLIIKTIADKIPRENKGGPFNNYTIELNGKTLAVGDRLIKLPGRMFKKPQVTVEIIIYFAVENGLLVNATKDDINEYMNKKYGDNWVFYKK